MLKSRLSINQDLLITFINGLAVLIGVIILNAMIARWYGLELLGEYTFLRRISVGIVGTLLVGMNVGLPYYLAKENKSDYAYASIGVFIFITIPALVLICGSLYFNWSEKLTWEYSPVYFLYMMGIAAQFLTYGLFRGHMNMVAANLVQLFGTALIPIVVFLVTSDLYKALTWIGGLTIILSILGFIYRSGQIIDVKTLFSRVVNLLKYGFVRLPSFLAQFILIAGIPVILSEEISFTDMAFLNSGISLVRLSLVIVTPIGMILLPRISSALSRNRKVSVMSGLSTLIMVTHVGSWIISISIYLHTEFLLKLWLGEVTLVGIWIVKVIILALPFYAVMGVLRSPIDAGSEKAYNSIIYFISAIFMILVYYFLKLSNINSIAAGSVAFIGGHISTTVLSLYYSAKLFGIRIKYLALTTYALLITIGLFALFQLLHYLTMPEYIRFLSFGLTLVITCLLFYVRSNQKWVVDLRSRLLKND